MLIDRFIDDAVEIDVDALYDGKDFPRRRDGHIEEAGIHSGDSSCALPPITSASAEIDRIREATEGSPRASGYAGLINIQFALGSDVLYVIEANPRASRTVPFVSKATGTPLTKAARASCSGRPSRRPAGLRSAAGDRRRRAAAAVDAPIAVKEAVLPFNRFRTKERASSSTPSSGRR